jgi:hypothetical protein
MTAMTHPMTRLVAFLGLSLSLAAPAAVAGRPHQHGVAELALVIEGSLVSAQLDTPLDSLVGFERAPRTPAERDRAQAALARLSAPDGLLPMPASAGCAAPSATVHAPVLQGEAAADGHADAQVTWTWRCARTDGLRSLTHGLFEAFAPLQRVQVTVVTATGQHRVTLRRPQRELRWGR